MKNDFITQLCGSLFLGGFLLVVGALGGIDKAVEEGKDIPLLYNWQYWAAGFGSMITGIILYRNYEHD